MRVGVLKEIKDNEFRVALTPDGARKLVEASAEVFVESGAGEGAGFSDTDFRNAGAIISNVKEILGKCELILKIKEPVKHELYYFNSKHTIFTYFHFASNKDLTEAMLKSGANCIAYETVTDDNGNTPLLSPMSEVAGRMAVHVGAYYLAKPNGGSGVLLQGITGVNPGKVVVLGGGFAGRNAVEVALGMGAEVVIIQRPGRTFSELVRLFPKAKVVESNAQNIEMHVTSADLVIGAVYVVGEKAPKLVSAELVSKMKKGSVIVDISIDQGGCCETSRPTSHSDPVYKVFDVIHYCVANMPGAFPRTSTFGITNATLPFVLKFAKLGIKEALLSDKHLMNGVNIWQGMLVNEGVAKAHSLPLSKLSLV
ncbi:MAG: alanine dehydrogenase [Candidatus Diapherotrites archaeon]